MFSLHDDGKGLEALMSIPNILSKMNNTDYKEWLNFILEASGVIDTLAKVAHRL